MKEYTHFDLEDAIYKVWQTADDIETLYKYHGDADKRMTEDEMANILIGIKFLHEMRCWQLMDMKNRVFKLNQYCTDPEKLAAREKMFPIKKKGKKK
jgi:hypothetical protein